MSASVFLCSNIIPEEISSYTMNASQRSAALAGNIYCNAIVHGLLDNDCDVNLICSIDHDDVEIAREKYSGKAKVHFVSKKKSTLFDYFYMCYRTFHDVLCFGKKNREKRFVFFDVMRPSSCIGGLIAAKIRHIPTLGIVMDVPFYRVEEEVSSIIDKLANRFSKVLFGKYDMYLLLSDQMKSIIPEAARKASMVMEGIYRIPENQVKKPIKTKDNELFTILYAGSLYYEYGIMNLVEAVRRIDDPDIRLKVYGRGNAEEEIINLGRTDFRISYEGLISHDDILRKEVEADLLVNPRPTDKDYVLYSFPSKTMEYMASGTPLIMADIPSLPDEYRKYLYLIQDNRVDSIKQAIIHVKGIGRDESIERAREASKFIIQMKNQKVQCQRILDFLEKTSSKSIPR